MGVYIIPAKFHQLRFGRFTIGEVDCVAGQLLMSKRAVNYFRRVDFEPSLSCSCMIVVIFLMSIVTVVKKEGFDRMSSVLPQYMGEAL